MHGYDCDICEEKVEAWGQEQMDRAVKALASEFEVLKERLK